MKPHKLHGGHAMSTQHVQFSLRDHPVGFKIWKPDTGYFGFTEIQWKNITATKYSNQ